MMGRGQAVVKDDSPLVGAVLYIVRGPRHIEEHGFPFVEDFSSEGGLRQRRPPRLPVGPDLDAIVVGQDQVERHLNDLGRIRADVGRVGEIVVDYDLLQPARRQKALLLKTAFDNRPARRIVGEALQSQVLSHTGLEILVDYDYVVLKEGRSALSVFGRIVAEHERDSGDRQAGLAFA